MQVWTASATEALLGECIAGLARIDKLVNTTYTRLNTAVIAWGQYLDDEHSTGEHWGLYATSAAVQILAMNAHARGGLATSQPHVAHALRLLPEDLTKTDALLAHKRDKGDFQNVLKLAAIAESLRPDDARIPASNEPPIVAELRNLALQEGGWTTRPAGTPQREVRERDLATAYVLQALGRYELGEVGLNARRWLAREVMEGEPMRGWDLLALTGLALTAHPPHPSDPGVVAEAIERIDEQLTTWTRKQYEVRVDRPMFKGFSVGTTTDYLFLHPEILAALFFLRRGNPPRTRAFVIEVAQAVAQAIARDKGLMVSSGAIAAVDQLWATRLLLQLRVLRDSEGVQAIVPVADEREVRRLAQERLIDASRLACHALRLLGSKEAGYRRLAAQSLIVASPIAAAVPVALLLFAHPAEGIGALVLGVLIAIGVGYYFFFKGSDS